ncbi:MAG: hypothetical protein UZ12_BCD005001989 [Bacteroidetes bacterium OLB12]|nr:MAG: hypothetical protein UZ12_BCD005001989 [Bacteroidetes bacterium OLB12]
MFFRLFSNVMYQALGQLVVVCQHEVEIDKTYFEDYASFARNNFGYGNCRTFLKQIAIHLARF